MARISRRGLLIGGAITAGAAMTGLAVGFGYLSTIDVEGLRPVPPQDDQPVRLNAWIEVLKDGRVRVAAPHTELGQGIHTGLAMLVAEELEIPLERITVEHPVKPLPVYANFVLALEKRPEEMTGAFDWVGRRLIGAMQLIATGGSTATIRNYVPLRQAGAVARNLLERAGAAELGVKPSEVKAVAGEIVDPRSGRRLSYGALAAAAALLEPQGIPSLKPRTQWAVIGRDAPRLDIPAKVDGSARFAVDHRPAGLLHATVVRPPRFDGTIESVDKTAAEAMPGVVKVLAMDNEVGVIAETSWQAMQAAERLAIRFGGDDKPGISSTEILAAMRVAVNDRQPGHVFSDRGDVDIALADDASFEATYETPYLAHATLEPQSAVAIADGEILKFWSGAQSPMPMMQAARAVGRAAETHVTLAGGGFGRRIEGAVLQQAARLAASVPGRPVMVAWRREDDLRWGPFRPAAVARLRAAIGPNAMPRALKAVVATQSVALGYSSRNMPFAIGGARDKGNVEGLADLAYDIPNILVAAKHVDTPVPVGFWRSVGHSNTAFFVESFIDELAHRAKRDPLRYRMDLLSKDARLSHLCRTLSEAAQWSGPGSGSGRGRGVAIHASFRSYVGQVVDVAVSAEKAIKVERIVAVIDCGQAINPQQVRAQLEGAIVFALSAAMTGEITIENGAVTNSNFHDYPMALMKDVPAIETVIIDSAEPPGGVGEPGTPPLFPALANALFAATAERVRTMPLSRHGYRFA
jgi:isoquinoline 1-oxidoreductase subunit beta